jgi:hypothetical protein
MLQRVSTRIAGMLDARAIARKTKNFTGGGEESHMKDAKIFDTTTLRGLKQAERFKTQLENKYDQVISTPVGLTRVLIYPKIAAST